MAEIRIGKRLPIVMAMGSFIRLVAIVTSLIVLVGFGLFAIDEVDRGSKHQQTALANELEDRPPATVAIDPTAAQEAARERGHGPVRELIDDANDVLLGPFADLVGSKNAWVMHGVPALMALLLYGLGLGLLANALPKQRARGGDWRAA
jgi:hypothetical protein